MEQSRKWGWLHFCVNVAYCLSLDSAAKMSAIYHRIKKEAQETFPWQSVKLFTTNPYYPMPYAIVMQCSNLQIIDCSRVCTQLLDRKYSSSIIEAVTYTRWIWVIALWNLLSLVYQNGQEYCTLKSVWYHRLSLSWKILQVPIRTICYRTVGAFLDYLYFWSQTLCEPECILRSHN